MKVIHVTDKVKFVRHWGKWYRVQRGGVQWQPLKPIIHRRKPAPDPFHTELTADEAAEELARRY